MQTIRFGIQTPQEGATYETLATHWREADALGFDSIWLNDHFYPVVRPRTEPQLEAWTVLGALARETSRIRIGILVTCNSYRSPALVAKMAATVDVLSGGRLVHGMGSACFSASSRGTPTSGTTVETSPSSSTSSGCCAGTAPRRDATTRRSRSRGSATSSSTRTRPARRPGSSARPPRGV